MMSIDDTQRILFTVN